MQLVRPAFAQHPSRFGRGPTRIVALPAVRATGIADDLKLFAGTFLAGFLFVSILIG